MSCNDRIEELRAALTVRVASVGMPDSCDVAAIQGGIDELARLAVAPADPLPGSQQREEPS